MRYNPENPYKHGGLGAVITPKGVSAPGFPAPPEPPVVYDPYRPYTQPRPSLAGSHIFGAPDLFTVTTAGMPAVPGLTEPFPGSHITFGRPGARAPGLLPIATYPPLYENNNVIPAKPVSLVTWLIIGAIIFVILRAIKK